MSSFSAAWLALREPADHRARSRGLTQAVREHLTGGTTVSVVDLAAGTGSNLRYLASGWDRSQTWLLVDQDAGLLSLARPVGSATVTTRVADLIDGGQLPAILERRDLITASALLDLVSRAWLEQIIAACQKARAAVLFALTYDGRMECSPDDPEDAAVRALVNQHQRTDKGFGAALGPDAAGCAAELLEAAGYRVLRESSDWRLQPDEPELQRQLILGWAEAAAELAIDDARSIFDWRDRRLAHVTANRSRRVIGHQDIAGWI
jgi:hypothetical protein